QRRNERLVADVQLRVRPRWVELVAAIDLRPGALDVDEVDAVLVREARVLSLLGEDEEPLGGVGDAAIALVVLSVVADGQGFFKPRALGTESNTGSVAQSHCIHFPVVAGVAAIGLQLRAVNGATAWLLCF